MTNSEHELEFTFAKNCASRMAVQAHAVQHAHADIVITRNSSGDEIANVNFLYDDIVHAVKIQ